MRNAHILSTVVAAGVLAISASRADAQCGGYVLAGTVNNFMFAFTEGTTDANWQAASKGYAGNVLVNGQASERTSGSFAFAGTIVTSSSTLGPWQSIVNQNSSQASASVGNSDEVSAIQTMLPMAMSTVNTLPVTPGFESVSASSLNGLNTSTLGGFSWVETPGGQIVGRLFVINVTSGFGGISSQINITGDANDIIILRWSTDNTFSNGYQGTVKFQSGGGIVPHGGLTPGNFLNVAGNISSSGGGSTPPAPYPQGPRLDNGMGALINGGSAFNGGGFFTGYWLTTGDPVTQQTSPLSNAIFVGGWYTTSTKFSLTSGCSGVYVSPGPAMIALLEFLENVNLNI